ncbi:hypothetical protein NL676_010101 [Syzygium grande]|nr:hypothetical protein NL676_010101 [Syzygium grande]
MSHAPTLLSSFPSLSPSLYAIVWIVVQKVKNHLPLTRTTPQVTLAPSLCAMAMISKLLTRGDKEPQPFFVTVAFDQPPLVVTASLLPRAVVSNRPPVPDRHHLVQTVRVMQLSLPELARLSFSLVACAG